MNSRLLISQSQKGHSNDHKADARYGWGPDFPFCSEVDQIDAEQYKQTSGDNKGSVSFHHKHFRLFYFLKNI